LSLFKLFGSQALGRIKHTIDIGHATPVTTNFKIEPASEKECLTFDMVLFFFCALKQTFSSILATPDWQTLIPYQDQSQYCSITWFATGYVHRCSIEIILAVPVITTIKPVRIII